jgi:PAS domain S-box-containing protein
VVLDITERKRVEGELRRSEARLVAEADALAKLDDLSSRLWQLSSLQEGLSEMLAAVVGLLGADKANVQLLDAERGVLNIVAQYGFEQPFLDFFREVSIADQSACGRSLCSGCRVVVEDIETDEVYAPLRAIARASNYRAVTSTPLVSSDGSILGMLSTHFKLPHRPTEESLLRLDLYARQAAGFVQQCKAKSVMSQRYAAIVDSSEDAIISKNLNAVIVTWNAGAQRLFGYTDAETIGQPITILIPPELRDEENKILEKLRTGECIEHYETVRVTNTGKRINVSLTISPMRDSTGKIVGFSKIARDISERKRTEEALRASEERLRLAQQAARIGTFEWNIRSGVNTWTPELEAMYGLPLGGFGGTQTAFENLVHPDDRARVIQLDNLALKTGQPATGEWRVVWPDGSVHWIAGSWQVFMNESGEPSRMIGVNTDVTERKLAEQELTKANERLRLAIEAGSVGGWDFDLRTGKNVWFGKAHAQLGMAHNETLGSVAEFWARVHEEDRARLERALQVSNERHEEFAEDFRVVWRDGTTHWLRSRGRHYCSANGQPERMLGISIDITQSKQAEQALREGEQRLRLATQAGRMYAYDWDATTNVVVRSSEHVKILGITGPLDFPQQQFVDKIHPDDRPKFLAAIAGLTPEYPTGEVTYRALASDDTLVWLKSNGRGFFDAEGRLLRVIGMVADVTDQKLAEEALRSSEERLRLAQRGARLGTFERDVRTGRITWSEGLESLYGLPSGSLDGKTTAFFKELIYPTDYDQAIQLLENALKTGQPTEGEWRAIWPDGSVHWIAGRWQVLMDASGEPWRVVGVNMDITGRKRVEEALLEMNRTLEAQGSLLRSQEELLRVFVKNVPAAVAMLDRDMRYLQVSDRWCSDYLPGRAQILGLSHYEIFPDMPERGKRFTAAPFKEKPCERTKTVGMGKTALIGYAGRFVLGTPLKALLGGFSSLQRISPIAGRWKKHSQI